MLSIIEFVFSLIGIIGYFNDNIVCMIIGLVGIIIGDFIDTFILGNNPFTILLAIIIAIGATIANKNPLYNFTVLMCGESFLTFCIGLLIILVNCLISLIKKENINKKEEPRLNK